jgi:signal transduction histidine kinase
VNLASLGSARDRSLWVAMPEREGLGPLSGLTGRTIVVSGLLALIIGAAFVVLVRAIGEERDSARLATESQRVLVAANTLERLVLDLETGQRGFLVSGDERFLEPWRAARAAIPGAIRQLNELAGVPAQRHGAREIAAAVDSYAREYSIPLVSAARRGAPSARSAAALNEGKRRVDAIRGRFDRFVAAEQALYAKRADGATADAHRAIVGATTGLAGSVLLIVLSSAYMTRAIVLPVRRAGAMAGRLAGGDLETRMPETGVAEIGTLERAFNTMAGSLATSRDELRLLAEEQAALRRVATLVARGVSPAEIFTAVAQEVGRLFGTEYAAVSRFEPDGGSVVLAVLEQVETVPVGTRLEPDESLATTTVRRTGRPARVDAAAYSSASGPVSAALRRLGIRSSVASPIVVEGRAWGAMVVASVKEPLPEDTEERMESFTELVGTAIANAESRAELAASRARVVATADETRRRLERDLHDGAQQRLVQTVIALKLARQSLGEVGGPAVELVDEALEHGQRAAAELRDLAHGILPAALSRGGLRGGVKQLASRARLPVSVQVTTERLPPALEATAYFIIAEALTNTAKHAHAHRADVSALIAGDTLRLEIRDDGIGGARIDTSTGLLGLRDRAAAMNGTLTIDSPPGGGTTIVATMPIRRA